MWEKNKGTTQCDQRSVTYDVRTAQCENGTCDVGTAQCKDGIVKCEKKVREPPNVTKEMSHMMLELHNVRIEPSNVRKK